MLQELLNTHCLDPKNPRKLYDLAAEYDRLDQGAMAVSLYLKTADMSDGEIHEERLLKYKSMIGIARCYQRQNNRFHTVETCYMDAIALFPFRPEAHFFIAEFYEPNNKWKQMKMHTQMGLEYYNEAWEVEDIPGFDGYQGLQYYDALATWYIAGTQTGKHAFFDLKYREILDDKYKAKVDHMVNTCYYPDTIPYKPEDYERFKFDFDGLEGITKNYSKHMQDLFVLAVNDGKRNGTYLEIGSGDPFVHNNTALLETEFNWKGISIDNSESLCYNFKENRNNIIICSDATTLNYEELFNVHSVNNKIDYLQIDCDEASLTILKNLPLDNYKFGTITFEHDSYRLGTDIRDEARSILKKAGYVLLVNDLGFFPGHAYEDWYVHPDLVDIKKEMIGTHGINFVWDYFMEEL